MSSRRKARETLLRALYLAESRGMSIDAAFVEMEDIDREIEAGVDPEDMSLEPFGLGLDDEQKEFALDLGRKIIKNGDEFNDIIRGVLQNWDFSRVSRIDRYIMWIALAEMKFLLDIPVRASINEAVELAKTYSSEKSPSFINGVLDAAARTMGALK